MTRIIKAAAVALISASLAVSGVALGSGTSIVKPASTGCCVR